MAVGLNKHDQCDVSSWHSIVEIAVGSSHTVGLKSDGTVTAVGWNEFGQCNVNDWTDIVEIAADNEYGQCDVRGWNGIQLPAN